MPATGGEELLGRRIAVLRGRRGFTQQQLADRCALSRVALSHLEAGMSQPSERTVALLAGVFGIEAHDLVEGTSYPRAKAERLPLVVPRYTEVELQLRLLEADLAWASEAPVAVRERVVSSWLSRLDVLRTEAADPGERALLAERRRALRTPSGG